MVTLAVTAIVAIGTTSLASLRHHSPRHLQHAQPRFSIDLLAAAQPREPGGRVLAWQTQRQLAAEAAAAAPAPAPPPPQPAARRPGSPPPAAAPPPGPPPAPGSVQAIIQQAFAPYGAGAVAWGLRVARCESGYNPRAYNPAGPYMGLFQFLMSTFRATPYGSGDIYDPVANANAAAWKFANGGASAWGCR